MARFSAHTRLLVAFLAALIFGSGLTACSKDKKKGTPVAERGTGGTDENRSGGDAGERGSDSTGTKEKATPKPSTNLSKRGSDMQSEGVQVDAEGRPAEVTKKRNWEDRRSPEDIRVTPVSEIGVGRGSDSSSGGFIDNGYGDGPISSSENLGRGNSFLRAVSPDQETLYIRANDRPYTPIATLATDPWGEFDFTDYTDDLALNTVLRLSSKNNEGLDYSDLRAGHNDFLPQAFFDESREFAGAIKDIESRVGSYQEQPTGDNVAIINVTYDYEGHNEVLQLVGRVDEHTGRAVLEQKSQNNGQRFQGYLTCLDVDGFSLGCQNAILVIEQVKNFEGKNFGFICKRVFSVVRNMRVGMTMSRSDYRNYFNERDPRVAKLLRYLSNTVLASRYSDRFYIPADGDDILLFGSGKVDTNGDPIAVIPTPYMDRITNRTFAVAHGYAESELLMRESNYSTLAGHEMTQPSLKDNRRDIFRVVGPLAKPKDGQLTAYVEVDGYIQDERNRWVKPFDGEFLMWKLVDSAEIVGNDGRGTMEIKFNLGGKSLMLAFSAENVPTHDPRNIKLYPYQGVEAPKDITPAMLPLGF